MERKGENGDQVGRMSGGGGFGDMFKVERFKRTGTASGYPRRNLVKDISTWKFDIKS